eukprot:CAMPEP_0114563050 /NCGR_PEP_ID=MMETSP0114-20121206/12878_1 /TAXON_ID=31324 /ORGANISM="Goniomonas sp, Strain m" /LENGTH=535 /DNA_ID=CAMNT_0001748821 /DNA_START=28 /DNA_END=1631 /DNA_ORIENTATION=-
MNRERKRRFWARLDALESKLRREGAAQLKPERFGRVLAGPLDALSRAESSKTPCSEDSDSELQLVPLHGSMESTSWDSEGVVGVLSCPAPQDVEESPLRKMVLDPDAMYGPVLDSQDSCLVPSLDHDLDPCGPDASTLGPVANQAWLRVLRVFQLLAFILSKQRNRPYLLQAVRRARRWFAVRPWAAFALARQEVAAPGVAQELHDVLRAWHARACTSAAAATPAAGEEWANVWASAIEAATAASALAHCNQDDCPDSGSLDPENPSTPVQDDPKPPTQNSDQAPALFYAHFPGHSWSAAQELALPSQQSPSQPHPSLPPRPPPPCAGDLESGLRALGLQCAHAGGPVSRAALLLVLQEVSKAAEALSPGCRVLECGSLRRGALQSSTLELILTPRSGALALSAVWDRLLQSRHTSCSFTQPRLLRPLPPALRTANPTGGCARDADWRGWGVVTVAGEGALVLDVRVVPESICWYAWLYFTGSGVFYASLVGHARTRGVLLPQTTSELAAMFTSGSPPPPLPLVHSEKEIFEYLG